MTKSFTLYMGTVSLIKELLLIGGWAVDIDDIYNGGKLIETLPDPAERTAEELTKKITIEVSSRQYNAICKAAKYHAGKGVILATPYALELIEQFELRAENKE